MLKYTTAEVTFREIPDEITLCINISNCPIHCPDCHSKELWGDIGEELTKEKLYSLIGENSGITCVCFMGGDNDPEYLLNLVWEMSSTYPDLKFAWYSGKHELYDMFDYVKIGPYIKNRGGLDNINTNQRLFERIVVDLHNNIYYGWEDITYKFWPQNDNNIS